METYLSIEGVAQYFGIAEKTIREWVLNDDIPFCKIRKVVRFRVSEIERWIDGGGSGGWQRQDGSEAGGAGVLR